MEWGTDKWKMKKKANGSSYLWKLSAKSTSLSDPLDFHWEMDSDLNSNILSNHTFQGFSQREDPTALRQPCRAICSLQRKRNMICCFCFEMHPTEGFVEREPMAFIIQYLKTYATGLRSATSCGRGGASIPSEIERSSSTACFLETRATPHCWNDSELFLRVEYNFPRLPKSGLRSRPLECVHQVPWPQPSLPRSVRPLPFGHWSCYASHPLPPWRSIVRLPHRQNPSRHLTDRGEWLRPQ